MSKYRPTGRRVAKLTDDQVRRYREAWANGTMSRREMMEESDLGLDALGKMLRGESYRHIGNVPMVQREERVETDAERSLKRLMELGVRIPEASAPAPATMTESEAKALIGPIPEPVEWEGGNPLDEGD